MTQAVLIQRPGESVIYDVDCSDDLPLGATITSITSTVFDAPATGITATGAIINSALVTWNDGRSAPIGTVIQLRIANTLVAPQDQSFVLRAKYNHSAGATPREATVILRIYDKP